MPASPGKILSSCWALGFRLGLTLTKYFDLKSWCKFLLNLFGTASMLPPPLTGRLRVGFAYESLKDRLPVRFWMRSFFFDSTFIYEE